MIHSNEKIIKRKVGLLNLAGSFQTAKVQEGSTRKNLAQMLETLADWNNALGK
jgi:hypothetical protein